MKQLPKLKIVQYEIILPSNGKKILFRPLTVGEEKILHIAQELDDDQGQIRALRQVLNNCLLTPLDVNKLAIFDLDYLWLKLRSKSIEEVIMLPFECHRALDEPFTDTHGEYHDKCGTVVNLPIDINKIEVRKFPENNPKIEIQDNIGIILRYPTFEIAQKVAAIKSEKEYDQMMAIVMECIEMVYEGDIPYEADQIDPEELKQFLESMTQIHFSKILHFFDTIPVLKHNVHFKCPKCKFEVDLVLEGTKTFLVSDSATKP